MDSMVLLASALAAAAVVLVSYGVWSLATGERQRVAWRVSRTGIGASRQESTAADVRVQGRSASVFQPVERALSRYSWVERARIELQKAEVHLHVSEFIALRVLSTLAVLAIGIFLAFTTDQLLVGIGAAFVAAFVWFQFGAFVKRRVRHRQAAIDDKLDAALVHIAGSLRAGFSFPQACQMALAQMEWPLKDEIQAMLEEVNVGASLDDALRHLAERVESYEVDITVNAVLVQRQVGGSLAEILDNVARTMRERRELRGHIMSLTAQQRLSAYFVSGVPILMCAFLSLTSWDFMKPLFTTFTGNILLAIGLLMDILGFLVMRRLTRIDF